MMQLSHFVLFFLSLYITAAQALDTSMVAPPIDVQSVENNTALTQKREHFLKALDMLPAHFVRQLLNNSADPDNSRLFDLVSQWDDSHASSGLESLILFYDNLGIAHTEYLQSNNSRHRCLQASALAAAAGIAAGSRSRSFASSLAEDHCEKLYRIHHTISDLPEFLTLSGYPGRGFINEKNSFLNSSTSRLIDRSESASPQQAWKLNFLKFISDPEYKCRRPTLNNYFVSLFDTPPAFAATLNTCQSTHKALVLTHDIHQKGHFWEEWDFSRLYRVDYLLSGAGDSLATQFGHSMLRLLFCAPSRKSVGPECESDLSSHRVVTFQFRAIERDLSIFKALSGSFTAHLLIRPFDEILQEVTEIYLRPLYSLPLALTPIQKQRLLNHILEKHWTYTSRYRFLDNNCAHETLYLIQSALYDVPRIHDTFVIRPETLYSRFVQLKLGKSPVEQASEILDNNELYEHFRKYLPHQFYPSQKEQYLRTFSKIKNTFEKLNKLSLQDYLELSPQARSATRRFCSHQHMHRNGQHEQIKVTPLEELCRHSLEIESLAAWRLFNNISTQYLPYLLLHKVSGDKYLEVVTTPLGLSQIKHGYGLPLRDETMHLQNNPTPSHSHSHMQTRFTHRDHAKIETETETETENTASGEATTESANEEILFKLEHLLEHLHPWLTPEDVEVLKTEISNLQ